MEKREVGTVYQQIKDTKEPGFTDAIFYLYDLAGDGADDVIAQMDVLLDKARRDGSNMIAR